MDRFADWGKVAKPNSASLSLRFTISNRKRGLKIVASADFLLSTSSSLLFTCAMNSMTGFGRAEHATADYIARVEIASVNRKQADIVCNLPRELAEIESDLRKTALAHISRGRITMSIHIQNNSTAGASIGIDAERVRALGLAFREISEILGRNVEASATDFLRAPDIFLFDQSNLDPELVKLAIQPALEAALQNLITMRQREGENLLVDFRERLNILEIEVAAIEKHAPGVVARHREHLHQRLRELELNIDPADERFLKEIALFAERCDISEEITRLRSHFQRFHEYLESPDPMGRSLDFLCQEIHREFNTIGSKANDAELAQHVVSSKTELEKIREQVQNVE